MFLVKLIRKLLKVLAGEGTPNQIAGAIVVGMFFGLMPLNVFNTVVILLFVALVRVNVTMFLLATGVFKLILLAVSPALHEVGNILLVDNGVLDGLWTAMYNAPILPLTNFNNTVMSGAILVSVVLAIPVFLGTRYGVTIYRNKLAKWVEKTWIGRLLKATRLYGIFGGVVEGS